VSNPQVQARVGQSFFIEASATDVNGAPVPSTELAPQWLSDNVRVCTVLPNAGATATVQCVGAGQCSILARFANRIAQVDVTVAAPLEDLVLTPSIPA
jgi:hypothetical protein